MQPASLPEYRHPTRVVPGPAFAHPPRWEELQWPAGLGRALGKGVRCIPAPAEGQAPFLYKTLRFSDTNSSILGLLWPASSEKLKPSIDQVRDSE